MPVNGKHQNKQNSPQVSHLFGSSIIQRTERRQLVEKTDRTATGGAAGESINASVTAGEQTGVAVQEITRS